MNSPPPPRTATPNAPPDSGLVLSFAGAVAAIAATNPRWSLLPGVTPCSYERRVRAARHQSRDFKTIELQPLRDRYLTSEAAFTELRLLDTRTIAPTPVL